MKLKLLVTSLIFSLIIAEVGVRFAGYRPILLNPDLFTGGQPYRLKAHFSGEFAGQHVTTDAEGNRTVINCRRPKILLLGDSIVFGQGLNDQETIASQLGVSNIGVPGYSSWNEYERLKEYLIGQEVNRVILIYVPNDVTFNNEGLAGNNFGVSPSRFHRLLRSLYSNLYISFIFADAIKSVTSKRTEGFNWEALDYSMEAVDKMARLRPLTVGIYRDVWYYHDPIAKEYEQRISSALDQRGIDHFLIHSHIDQLTESRVKIGWNDPHPSKKAAELIAGDIRSHL